MANNKFCILLPAWLNQRSVLEMVRNSSSEMEVSKLQSFKIVPITNKQYSPEYLRIYCALLMADGSKRKSTYILKTSLPHHQNGQIVQEMQRLQNEMAAYDVLMPEFEKLYMDIDKPKKFAPERYAINSNPFGQQISLCYEDVIEANYERITILNQKHTEAVNTKLAELHAASVVCHQWGLDGAMRSEGGFLDAVLRLPYFESRCEMLLLSLKQALPKFHIIEWQIFECYLPSAEKFVSALRRLNAAAAKAKFQVLNHGELWHKSICFQYENPQRTKICDVLFENYDLCKYAPPWYDLYVLTLTSVTWECRKNLAHVRDSYYKSLRSSLKRLKFSGVIPTLTELNEDMQRNRLFAFFVALTYLPLALMPTEKQYNFENIMSSDADHAQIVINEIMSNKAYCHEMNILYPSLCLGGYLNCN